MLKSVLIVDDYESFRRFLKLALQSRNDICVVAEASDGLEAVNKAKELQPDLILLDIGLPEINGLEAARRIRNSSPNSKILIVSQEKSVDIVQEALRVGASGYVLKSSAASELLPGVNAVLEGKRFVSASLGAHPSGPRHPQTGARFHRRKVATLIPTQNAGSARHHEAEFYSDDDSFLDGFAQFIGSALMAGKAAIVVATELHRDSLLRRLQADGLDIGAAVEEGRYISLDVADTLSTFMVSGSPDPVRFLKVAGDLILEAAKAVNGETAHVAACGECAPLLWMQGNMEAAIRVEHLWDEIAIAHNIDILCGYALSSFQGGVGSYAFEKICSAHSAVHTR